jgi:hypothetical protein
MRSPVRWIRLATQLEIPVVSLFGHDGELRLERGDAHARVGKFGHLRGKDTCAHKLLSHDPKKINAATKNTQDRPYQGMAGAGDLHGMIARMAKMNAKISKIPCGLV